MSFLTELNNYWALIVFIGGALLTVAYFKFSLQDVSKEIVKLETRVEAVERAAKDNNTDLRSALNILQNTLTEVYTTVKFLREEIKELKSK